MTESMVDRMKLEPGAIRATCYIERSPSGLWVFYSEEWRGMLLCHHDLATLLGTVPEAGKGLCQAMQDWHAKTPYTNEDQLRQMKIYEDFFGTVSRPDHTSGEI
jgi:hypothetical protein